MSNHVRKQIFIFGIVLMLVLVSWGFSVSAQNSVAETSTIFIDSRFKLWDLNEKMMDSSFNITIIYYNLTSNNSAYYKIDIDNKISEGFFTNYIRNEFTVNDTSIHSLRIYINNESVFETTNIIITNQVSKSLIDYANSEWTINLSPFQWTQKEQNIFISVIICGILSIVISYKITIKYRKGRGIKTHK